MEARGEVSPCGHEAGEGGGGDDGLEDEAEGEVERFERGRGDWREDGGETGGGGDGDAEHAGGGGGESGEAVSGEGGGGEGGGGDPCGGGWAREISGAEGGDPAGGIEEVDGHDPFVEREVEGHEPADAGVEDDEAEADPEGEPAIEDGEACECFEEEADAEERAC